jgi:hypothetical protein
MKPFFGMTLQYLREVTKCLDIVKLAIPYKLKLHRNTLLYKTFQDENSINRPVCSFVKPLRGGRLLDSARHAARFVSLMHHEKIQSLGGGHKTEQWTTIHGFLCRNRGVSFFVSNVLNL